MGDSIRVMIELGRKRPVAVAVAFDWPGWERSGTSEEDALRVLDTYRGRYARVAKLAGLAEEFSAIGDPVVVERLEGIGMTDFYGLSMRAAGAEEGQMSGAACERKIALLRACWTYFDEVASRVSAELRKGPRGGGRDRDRIVQHVNNVETGDFARKVGVITPTDAWQDPDALRDYREAFCAAIREYNARGAPARTWTVQFVIRHSAYHVLDHTWEMEDRDLAHGS
ncbi:MAG: hypothetical protein E6G68_00225 [Actinobacteria bacterium]|nr:MAG: hypothetical protein E6G68_00225 [Actinomycetota bacterium]